MAKANPDEIQQMYLMSDFVTARSNELRIKIMEHFYKDQLKPNTKDNHRWWEIIDRTTDEVMTNWIMMKKQWKLSSMMQSLIMLIL